jgi:hypothetical protein
MFNFTGKDKQNIKKIPKHGFIRKFSKKIDIFLFKVQSYTPKLTTSVKVENIFIFLLFFLLVANL